MTRTVSSYFDAVGSGLLWTLLPSSDPHNFAHGHLYVYNASDLSGPLFTSDLGSDPVIKFTPPLIANGKVYVVTAFPHILVFGL